MKVYKITEKVGKGDRRVILTVSHSRRTAESPRKLSGSKSKMSDMFCVHVTNRQVTELSAAEDSRVTNEIKRSWEIGLSVVILKMRCGCNFLLWNFLGHNADSCTVLYHGPKLVVPAKDTSRAT